jgi:hypothetical protein
MFELSSFGANRSKCPTSHVLHTVEVPFCSLHPEKCADPEDVFSVNTFDELQLDARMVKNLADLAITQLTTIQARALPVILGGKDALVKSQTGSGKTLTYAVPIMQVIVVLFCCTGSGIRCLFDPGIRDG